MNSKFKKFASGALMLTTTVWLSGLLLFAPVGVKAATVDELNAQIQQLMQTIATLQAALSALQGGGGGTGVAVACSFTRSLTVGSTGDDVKCLQRYLNGSGFALASSGVGSPGNESSYFGPLTRDAVAKWQAANNVSPAVGYFGPISKAKYSSLAASGTIPGGDDGISTDVGVVIPSSGISVSRSSANPAGKAIPYGANNVEFLRFNLAGSGDVSSVILSRIGPGSTSDFASSGLYLIDENGTRLTTGRTVNSTTHKVTFTGLNISLNNSVKTLRLIAAMRTNASGAGNRNAFEISSASDVVSTNTVSGAFPIKGNEFTLTSAGVGGVTISSSTDPTNPKVGERKAKVATLKLENTSSTDDLNLKSVTLRYAGAVSRSYLSNFVMEYAGSRVGSGANISSKDLLTLNFDPPFLLERGQNKIFEVFADISPSARAGSSETIIWYVEDANDVVAESVLYGYGAIPTNSYGSGSSNGQHMTVDGGQITITYNGPASTDIPTNSQDVEFMDFTITSANNVEVRNLRFSFTSTGMGSATNEKLSDFKVTDASSGAVVAGPYGTDITTTTASIVLSDTFTINAGESRRFKLTADVGSASALADDTAYFTLSAFNSTDIRNVDSNNYVAVADIVPNGTTGNTMTMKAADLTVTLSGSPSGQTTITAGTYNHPLVAFNIRAVADDVQLRSLQVKASGTEADVAYTDVINALGSIRLMVDGQQLGQSKGLSGSSHPVAATFDSLNYTIPKGTTKTIKVESIQISNSASSSDYIVFLNDLSSNVIAVDSDGNTLSLSGSVNADKSAYTTVGTPSLTIARYGTGSTDTDAGFLVDGNTTVLTRLQLSATNGDVTVKKLQFGVANTSTVSVATSTGLSDEVLGIYLKECTTPACTSKTTVIGGTNGLPLDATGATAGTARAENSSGFFTVNRGDSKFFTVEARLGQIQTNSSEQADSGTQLFASILSATNFEAISGNTTLTSMATSTGGTYHGIIGNQKILFKAQPTIAVSAPDNTLLATGLNEVIKVTVGADGGAIALKSFGINIAAAGATVSAPSTSNVTVDNLTSGTSVTIGTVSGAVITGGSSGDLYIILGTPETIYSGSPQTYQISVTAADVSTTANAATLNTKLDRNETTVINSVATNDNGLLGSTGAMIAGKTWVWSDLSDDSTATETNTQWSNAYLLRPWPTTSFTIQN